MSVYHISFDTKKTPGKIRGVKVTIEEVDVEMTETVNVALCDDPLYEKLFDYVQLNNPT